MLKIKYFFFVLQNIFWTFSMPFKLIKTQAEILDQVHIFMFAFSFIILHNTVNLRLFKPYHQFFYTIASLLFILLHVFCWLQYII